MRNVSATWRNRLVFLFLVVMSAAACRRGQQPAPVRETVVVQQTVVVERIVEVTPTPDPRLQPVTLHLNLGEEPYSFDPARAAVEADLLVVANLFQGLTVVDARGAVQPALAESWQVSDDGLRWTFALRPEIVWATYQPSRGVSAARPITADDVVFALRRACDPRSGVAQAALGDAIAGCRAARSADVATLSVEEVAAQVAAVQVVALDPRTVQINLLEPAGYLPALLSLPFTYPLPQEMLEAHGEDWTEPGNLPASGPFVLGGWFHGDSLMLLHNPLWYGWSQAGGNVDQVAFTLSSDTEAALASFRAGELDSLALTPEQAEAVQADPALAPLLSSTSAGCTEYLALNSSKTPLDNVLVRRALAAALDRQALVQRRGVAAHTFTPGEVFGSAADDVTVTPWAAPQAAGGWSREQALQQAQAWLAEAGYAGGAGFPPITLLHNAAVEPAAVAEAIAAQWRAGLGIEVQVQSLAWPEFSAVLSAETPTEALPDVWRTAFCGAYPDQQAWIGKLFNTEEGDDPLRWAVLAAAPAASAGGRSFNQLTAEAARSADPATRQALYQAAERILADEMAVVIPLVWYTQNRLVQANIRADAPYYLAAWRK